MPTRNVVLTAHHEQLIGSLVESGRYQNASEVLREGLRLVGQREAEDAARIEALRLAVDIGSADIDAGRCQALGSRAEIADYLADIDASGNPQSARRK